MILVLSPAKSLDYDTPLSDAVRARATEPLYTDQAAELIAQLAPLTPPQVASLMDLSDALASLNVGRYAAWQPQATEANSRPALLAFNGDVYDGLQARSLSPAQLDWAQHHLVILSGLYGALRPMDRLQPYRLEMGTRLANPRGKDLYAFWGTRIAEHLNERLDAEAHPVLVNLASQEYFRSVPLRALRHPVVECVFEDWKGAGWKIISFHAKRARGLMARWMIEQRPDRVDALRGFDRDGYAWDAAASTPERLVFRRRLAA